MLFAPDTPSHELSKTVSSQGLSYPSVEDWLVSLIEDFGVVVVIDRSGVDRHAFYAAIRGDVSLNSCQLADIADACCVAVPLFGGGAA